MAVLPLQLVEHVRLVVPGEGQTLLGLQVENNTQVNFLKTLEILPHQRVHVVQVRVQSVEVFLADPLSNPQNALCRESEIHYVGVAHVVPVGLERGLDQLHDLLDFFKKLRVLLQTQVAFPQFYVQVDEANTDAAFFKDGRLRFFDNFATVVENFKNHLLN